MTFLRYVLGLASLAAFTVGVVGGATGFGMVWPWTVGATTGLLWAVVRAWETDRVRDPITLPPRPREITGPAINHAALQQLKQDPETYFANHKRPVWPHEIGFE